MRRISRRQRHVGYDPVSKALHWITAGLVTAMFVLVLAPRLVSGSIYLHKALGMMILVVVAFRFVWRLTRPKRDDAGRKQTPQQLVANLVHLGFYGLLFAIPLLGWAYLGAKAVELDVFGIALPSFTYFGTGRDVAADLYALKKYLSYGMLALIGLHAGAALFHHYVHRDDVLRSMLPRFGRREGAKSGAGIGLAGAAQRPTGAD
jgi:cytochrome b561